MGEDWQHGPRPMPRGRVIVREVQEGDAEALLHHLSHEEVCRYIPPPPATTEAFRRFIADAQSRRRDGLGCTFAVVQTGADDALGLIQLLAVDRATGQWTWGFLLAVQLWGTGAFADGAAVALTFLFEVIGANAADAWVLRGNRRALQALRKLGRPAEERRVFGTSPDGRTADFIVHTMRNPTKNRG